MACLLVLSVLTTLVPTAGVSSEAAKIAQLLGIQALSRLEWRRCVALLSILLPVRDA